MNTAELTWLDAINIGLRAQRKLPLQAEVQIPNDPEARRIEGELRVALNETLQQGWFFNTLPQFYFTVGLDGTIDLPNTVIRLSTNSQRVNSRYVPVGRKLFDKLRGTYKIPYPLRLDVVTTLEWSALPFPVALYVARLVAVRLASQIGELSPRHQVQLSADLASAEAMMTNYDDGLRT